MLVTVSLPPNPPVDLEVAPGTPVAQVLAHVGHTGPAWCGPLALSPDHRAGSPPLEPGALLTAAPGPAPWAPTAPALLAVAGPDAGGWTAVTGPTTVGTDAAWSLADPTLDAAHLRVTTGRDGTLVASDLGSLNGTLAARRAGPALARRRVRRGTPLADGDLLLAGRTVLRVRASGAATVRPWPRAADPRAGLPDPFTAAQVWSAPVAVRGAEPWRSALMRAVVLARGRAPAAGGWNEPWTRWLPPAQPTDGQVLVGPGLARGGIELLAGATRSEVRGAAGVHDGPPVAVGAAHAEARARQRHAESYRLPSAITLGDLAADLAAVRSGPGALAIAATTWRPGPDRPWSLDPRRDGPLVVIGSGSDGGCDGAAAAVCAALERAGGPALVLDPRRRIPTGLARVARAEDVASAITPGLTVVIHRLEDVWGSPCGRDTLDGLVRECGRDLALVVTTDSPSGALPASMRARAGTTLALRTRTGAQSRDLIGVEHAARPAPQGRVWVRSRDGLREMQLARATWEATRAVASA